MSWVAVAIGGAAVIGGVSSNQAAKAQRKSADQATQAQLQMYDQTREDLDPYRQQGQRSLQDMGTFLQQDHAFGLDDFKQSPAYQFNLGEGMAAINKAAAARGKYYNPATLQDIGKYSQGVASNEFQNAFNNYRSSQGDQFSRLFNSANMGQNAAAMVGQTGANAANQIGQNTIGSGNAQAAGIMGMGNAAAGGVGDAYNQYLMSQVLGQRQQPTYSVGGNGQFGGTGRGD